jgi:acetyl esterase/lipase
MKNFMKKHWIYLLFGFTTLLFGQDKPKVAFRLPDGVVVKSDIVYSSYGTRELHLDLYLPKEGKGPFPGLVFIHGGAWSGGNRTYLQRQAAHMATKGFVSACIEYRFSGEAKYPAAVYDSRAAVRWLRSNAAKYNVNPNRIGAAGGSAGGHLAALLGSGWKVKELEGDGGNPGVSSRVQAVVAFNPVTDFVFLGKNLPRGGAANAVSSFIGSPYPAKPDLWAQASPITHVDADCAPILFLHGTADPTVPYSQSVDMMNKLKSFGVKTELFSAEGAKHGFFNGAPFYEPTVKKMEEFFIGTLGR